MTKPDPGAPGSRPGPLLVVVAGVVVGLLVGLVGNTWWRPGCVIVGGSLLVAALQRLLLPERAAGLLQVRTKGFDVAVLALAGAAVIALALAVPPGR